MCSGVLYRVALTWSVKFKLDLCLLWQTKQDVTSLGSDKSIPIHARIIGAVYTHYWNTADDISDSRDSTEYGVQIVFCMEDYWKGC